MKEKETFEEPVVDEKYVESTESIESARKDGKYSWGFYALCGCVVFALYEIISSIVYFF